MPSRSISSVIFDLGGVLLNWDVDRIASRVFADPEVRAAVKEAVFQHPDWAALDRGTLTEEEAVQRFARRSAQPVAAVEKLMQAARESLTPKPESMVLLDELRESGLDLYCLSNMHARVFSYLEKRYIFWKEFKGIVISARVRMIKPEPDIYQHLLSTHGLDPERSIFIDDHPANVRGAHAAGMHTILFTGADDCRRQLYSLLGR